MDAILTPTFLIDTGFPIAITVYLLYERRETDKFIRGMLKDNDEHKGCEVEENDG